MKNHNNFLIVGLAGLTLVSSFLGAYFWPFVNSTDLGQNLAILFNAHDKGWLKNPVLPSLVDFSFHGRLASLTPFDQICDQNWKTDVALLPFENHLKFHFYLIVFFLAPLLNLFAAPTLLAFLHYFCLFSIVLLASWFLLRRGVSLPLVVLAPLLICLHPSWNSQFYFTTFYFDRLYVPLGLLLCMLLDSPRKRLIPILLVTVISSLTSEKALLYNSGLFLAFSILNVRSLPHRNVFSYITLSGLLLIVFFIITTYFLTNEYYSGVYTSVFNLEYYVGYFSQGRIRNGIWVLSLVSLPFLIINPLKNWRWVIISVGALAPNVFFTVGGAEKTGFSTHYHSTYLPFIFFALLSGIATTFNKDNNWSPATAVQDFQRVNKLTPSLLFLVTLYALIDISQLPKMKVHSDFYQVASQKFARANTAHLRDNFDKIKNVVDNTIPKNSNVVLSNHTLPFFYDYDRVSYFPYNLADAEVVVAARKKFLGQPGYIFYEGYLGAEHDQKVNQCYEERLRKLSFNLAAPDEVIGGIALLKKLIE